MLRDFRFGRLIFQIFFLKDDEKKSVVVEEVSEIDFEKVKGHLENGESVFIAPKRQEETSTRPVEKADVTEPWYFIHI